MKIIIITILTLISVNNVCYSQNKEEISSYNDLFKSESQNISWRKSLTKSTNEVEFIFSGLYLGYKNFVSSQDINSCVFTPSCSTYSIRSIKKDGLIIGTLKTFDRLTRCNPLSPENYQIDKKTGRFLDY